MREIFLASIVILFISACSLKEEKASESNDDVVFETEALSISEITEEEKGFERNVFNVYEYKQKVDSLLTGIIYLECQSDLIIDTLKSGDYIFVELRGTELENIVSESRNVVKYSFPLKNGDKGVKHHIVSLDFNTENTTDSVFNIFKKVALEKSGVPGLAYTSDYLVQISDKIYWINSNCAFSYENHSKFVNAFKELVLVSVGEEINCKCGEVRCNISVN